jgi:hypothetical protein
MSRHLCPDIYVWTIGQLDIYVRTFMSGQYRGRQLLDILDILWTFQTRMANLSTHRPPFYEQTRGIIVRAPLPQRPPQTFVFGSFLKTNNNEQRTTNNKTDVKPDRRVLDRTFAEATIMHVSKAWTAESNP